MSVRPPSYAYHQDILPQMDLDTAGVQYCRLNCGYPCLMFSMHTAFRIVGPKRQSTVLPTNQHDKDCPVSGRCVASSSLHGHLWTHTNVGAAVMTDLLCVLLPMLLFRTLQVSVRDKVAIFIMLGLGLL